MEFNNKLKPAEDRYQFPLRVYHGTNEEFEDPDLTRAGKGAGNIYGTGIYASAHPESAIDYGKFVNEYDLDLKKPFYPKYDAAKIDPVAMMREIFPGKYDWHEKHKNDPNYTIDSYITGKLANPEWGLMPLLRSHAENNNTTVQALLQRMGIDADGIVMDNGHQIITFDPKQMKFVNRNITQELIKKLGGGQ